MEFRTSPPGDNGEDNSGGGGIDIDGILGDYIEGVKEDPAMQLRVLNMAQENGIDPMLLQPLVDIDENELQQLQQAQQQQQQQQQQPQQANTQMPDTTKEDDVTPDELAGFIDELMEYLDEDTTLTELKEFVEENPGMTETAIKMKL